MRSATRGLSAGAPQESIIIPPAEAAAPGAEEVINYGVPMFRLDGRNLVSIAAAKTHCSFFVQSPTVMEALAEELTGFATSKGTIRFQPGKPIPAALVRKIVKARIAENKAASMARKT